MKKLDKEYLKMMAKEVVREMTVFILSYLTMLFIYVQVSLQLYGHYIISIWVRVTIFILAEIIMYWVERQRNKWRMRKMSNDEKK